MAERTGRRNALAAAGTIPWRRRSGHLEVALVHRPRYDDWSWPKGKLDPGEDWPATAIRETWEETGLRVRLGQPLPANRYVLSGGATKEVRYWAGEIIGGEGILENEIDEVRWLTPAKARRLLTARRDLRQLEALTHVPTRTVMIVRHAHAVSRKAWDGDDDRLRPLEDAGTERADALRPLLDAYDIRQVICSPSTRCADTMRPYLRHHDVTATWSIPLSEEGYADNPNKLRGVVTQGLDHTDPVAFCSHGPVLGALLDEITGRLRTPGKDVKRTLRTVRRNNLDKGEALVLHISHAKRPAIIAVERHRP